MKHDEHASAELLEVIELTRQFLESEKLRGLQHVVMGRETWGALEAAVERAHVSTKKEDSARLLNELSELADGCTKCKLSETRANVVFGEGNP